jgi:hypothetical protein
LFSAPGCLERCDGRLELLAQPLADGDALPERDTRAEALTWLPDALVEPLAERLALLDAVRLGVAVADADCDPVRLTLPVAVGVGVARGLLEPEADREAAADALPPAVPVGLPVALVVPEGVADGAEVP